MTTIGIEIGKEWITDKDIDYRVFAALKSYSWYDKKNKNKKILKKKTKYGFIESVTYGLSRYKYNKAIKFLFDIGYIREDEDERYYVIDSDIVEPFTTIENENLRELLKYLDDDCLRLYIWLNGMYLYAEYYGNQFVLTYKRILSHVYGITYNTKNVKKAREKLKHLIKLGLVSIVEPWYYDNKKCMLLLNVGNIVNNETEIHANKLDEKEKRNITPTKDNKRTDVPQYFNGKEYYYDVMYEEDRSYIYNKCDENADWFSYWGLSIHI